MTWWVICLSLGVLAVGEILYAWRAGLFESFSITLVDWRGDNNHLARRLLLSLPLWWFLWTGASPRLRPVVITGLALTPSAVVLTYSRSGFVVLTVDTSAAGAGPVPPVAHRLSAGGRLLDPRGPDAETVHRESGDNRSPDAGEIGPGAS